jgi:N-methylhydantoinase B/oxoprolinase/acetone carboxylase alpha subunit
MSMSKQLQSRLLLNRLLNPGAWVESPLKRRNPHGTVVRPNYAANTSATGPTSSEDNQIEKLKPKIL